jgi:hypothetical protein
MRKLDVATRITPDNPKKKFRPKNTSNKKASISKKNSDKPVNGTGDSSAIDAKEPPEPDVIGEPLEPGVIEENLEPDAIEETSFEEKTVIDVQDTNLNPESETEPLDEAGQETILESETFQEIETEGNGESETFQEIETQESGGNNDEHSDETEPEKNSDMTNV